MRSCEGSARVDRRTKDLVKRLHAGEIAIINHRDLDMVAAESLLKAQPTAVINADTFSSGRYPNSGPYLLLEAGIQLVERVGPEVMEAISEGDAIKIVGSEVYVGDDVVARGVVVDREHIAEAHEAAEGRLDEEYQRFVNNTLEYLERDRTYLVDELHIPEVETTFKDRHVLIVVRGASYKDDLNVLRTTGYLAEKRPIIVGVDGGADALVAIGLTPDMIIGDFDSVSDATLRSGAELIVHAYPDGRAPGAARLDELGIAYKTWATAGTSEDIAMLLAYDLGAELIVAVGTHSSMVDFLEKGRAGMASTVLVRMKVGTHLFDAKGVSRLYHQNVRRSDLMLMVLSAVAAMAAVLAINEPMRLMIRTLWANLTNLILF